MIEMAVNMNDLSYDWLECTLDFLWVEQTLDDVLCFVRNDKRYLNNCWQKEETLNRFDQICFGQICFYQICLDKISLDGTTLFGDNNLTAIANVYLKLERINFGCAKIVVDEQGMKEFGKKIGVQLTKCIFYL